MHSSLRIVTAVTAEGLPASDKKNGDHWVWLCRSTMCLAIPGKILSSNDALLARTGRVQFGGIVREVRLDFVPEAQPGDFVMVHVGFAISKVDEDEARRTYALLAEMGALEGELPPEETS